jgi:hypothetical protein
MHMTATRQTDRQTDRQTHTHTHTHTHRYQATEKQSVKRYNTLIHYPSLLVLEHPSSGIGTGTVHSRVWYTV